MGFIKLYDLSYVTQGLSHFNTQLSFEAAQEIFTFYERSKIEKSAGIVD